MSRAAKVFFGIAGVLVLAGLLAVLLLLRHGFSARKQPTMLETVVARTMRHLAVPGSDRSMKNPVPLSQDILAAGMAHFADHCATCHGNDGKGKTEIGQNLYPKAPDMTA